MRSVVRVLGVALMVAGFLVDNSVRSRRRRAGGNVDKDATTRLPFVLFCIGAVLLVLASI
jgi:hypothetical protein